ncbi:Homeodomain-like DNA binding domain-containing transcription factor [Phycomyces blakesleeanus NRRL 1555(-)]|uniref:Homeodomain-like DNA binding domain-containing transcription factor n=1 Tax=Phycomyces blakesleeanus (strain ATCC 8743b / DSM 1359 / FGSC 10004 / NBRC 33097 / NRRL 1555) TaxID=763407 RepID=A0A167J7R2_PHYB8|nr:Homeodomain-like DNA binding domain-containing transcription factor [Phycomyces blakesleeanus NRRL 1555(-)]OAD65418.1 Homeodomain-like DNA binding domain-containing transcription factor [Phycomyces blakesleeanus NRRL 1555(-)]|eukprot:XP_018283458.1 Homeodomain-like DNA binding domain-containing transcription factor [Phycomyces blakesleeanus NRRL 1555(-)]
MSSTDGNPKSRVGCTPKTQFDCGGIIWLNRSGMKVPQISNLMKIPKSTVRDVIKRMEKTGTTELKPRTGRPKKIVEKYQSRPGLRIKKNIIGSSSSDTTSTTSSNTSKTNSKTDDEAQGKDWMYNTRPKKITRLKTNSTPFHSHSHSHLNPDSNQTQPNPTQPLKSQGKARRSKAKQGKASQARPGQARPGQVRSGQVRSFGLMTQCSWTSLTSGISMELQKQAHWASVMDEQSFLPGMIATEALVEFVQELVRKVDYTNKVVYVGALFVNFLFIKMPADGLLIPTIDQSLFASVFADSVQETVFQLEKTIQKKKEAPAQKQPADFINDIDKGCQIWAVDPGVCDIITAIDTSGRQRTTSVNEYYHLRGFNDAPHKYKNKFFLPASTDHTEAPVKTSIAFGDGVMNMEMYMLYEYLTSQVCNEFKKRNVENLVNSKSKRRVHAILQLQETTCNIVWNRDIMAVHNILDIFLFSSRNNNQRPDVSVRQTETNPGHQPSSV